MQMPIGERIKLARTLNGMSLRELSSKVGVTHQAISKYESNQSTPSSDVLLALADALGVKLDFFFRRPLALAPARYRKRMKLPKRESAAILARVQDWLERYVEAELLATEEAKRFRIPGSLVRSVSSIEDAERVANQLREAWELGTHPIGNLTELLEDKGIRIELVDGHQDFDACTIEVDNLPVIAVKDGIPGDRQRFDIAHELGHIIMQISDTVDEERAANRFAGAFLIPAEAALQELGRTRRHLHIGELHSLKLKYGVSMQAWIYRAKDLGILPPATAKTMFRKFRAIGKEEPGKQLQQERPRRMERLALKALAEGIISESRVAELLNKPVNEVIDYDGLNKGAVIL